MPALAGLLSRAAKWPSVALAAAVFAFLDVLDVLLCLVYAVLDGLLEESPVPCYCHRTTHGAEEDDGVSDTLYVRRSAFRDALLGLLRTAGVGRWTTMRRTNASPEKARSPRWSDCSCVRCLAWRSAGGGRLHFVVKEPTAPPKGPPQNFPLFSYVSRVRAHNSSPPTRRDRAEQNRVTLPWRRARRRY
jgi:hypothetical protein